MKQKIDFERWNSSRPERTYASLEEARRKSYDCYHGFGENRLTDVSFWPCLECGGRGKIYDPDEPIDPVEGHKFSSRIPCPDCRGSGNMGKPAFTKWYNGETAKWRAELAEFKKTTAVLRRLQKKLTDEEYDALCEYCCQR
jgi:hypothetical protein